MIIEPSRLTTSSAMEVRRNGEVLDFTSCYWLSPIRYYDNDISSFAATAIGSNGKRLKRLGGITYEIHRIHSRTTKSL
jgi:hypothetical protein